MNAHFNKKAWTYDQPELQIVPVTEIPEIREQEEAAIRQSILDELEKHGRLPTPDSPKPIIYN